MKYKDIDIEKARKCCADHHRKCEICPLERTEIDEKGKKHHLFCWYVIKMFYEGETFKENLYINTQLNLLMNEEISNEDRWLTYLLESEE